MAFDTLDRRAAQIAGVARSGEPEHSNTVYGRHHRYWIPLDHPQVLGFYVNHLFVPRSRLEMLRGAIARAAPWTGRKSLLHGPLRDGDPLGGKAGPRAAAGAVPTPMLVKEIGFEGLASLLERQLRQTGLPVSGPPALLMLDDHQDSTRQQLLAFLFDPTSAVPFAVAKVSGQATQRTVLEHEFKALTTLQGRLSHELLNSIPRPLALVERAGLTVLLETFMPGRSIYCAMRNDWYPRRDAAEHFRQAGEWLVQFQKATESRDGRLEESALRDQVAALFETFERHCDPSAHERRMITYAIEMTRKMLGGRLPLAARQGDFWARNLIVHGGTVGVVDWERFRERSLPFADLFMFATSYGLSYPWKLGCWAEPVAAFRATYLERTWLANLIRAYLLGYCDAMNVSPDMLEVFFLAFLAEQALEENRQRERKKQESGVRLWRSLVQEYARHGGSACFG